MEKMDIGEAFLMSFIAEVASIKAPPVSTSVSIIEPGMRESILRKDVVERSKPEVMPKQLKPSDLMFPKKIENVSVSIKKEPVQNISNFSQMSQLPPQERIGNILRDPFVTEIECVNFELPLFVKKSGIKQKTNVKFSIEDVYELIAHFSQKTRIPVINGTIKTAYNNLVITGMLSGSNGPRFIIQKRRYSI